MEAKGELEESNFCLKSEVSTSVGTWDIDHVDRLHAHSFEFALAILWLIICMVVSGLQELLHIFFGRIRINARA